MPEENYISIELAMIDSVARQNIEGLVGDVAEVTLDTLTSNEFLSAIPIFGAISKIYGGVVAIRDRIFLKKVFSFLVTINDVSTQERENLVSKLEMDAGSLANAGEALLLILDRMDDFRKPEMLGRVYLARLTDRIDYSDLRRFSSIIERAFLPDIMTLEDLRIGQRIEGIAGHQLESLGLASITSEDHGTFDGIGAKVEYQVNELGSRFIEIIIDSSTST